LRFLVIVQSPPLFLIARVAYQWSFPVPKITLAFMSYYKKMYKLETNSKKVEEAYKDAANAKPGSITAKANLVKAFDERNKKK
jgi:hypothetical protein